MNIIKVFGTNVRKYRLILGISQEKFAEKCGLHRTYISDVECFRRSISLDNIQKIADALEIETYKLFLEEELNVKKKNKN
ncbi:MAG: helix-turn-helix transcriptional regulator [Ruminococcus callidus]|nr:helix-turn-helix transcriptional regulator [Ruminococcus callidus]